MCYRALLDPRSHALRSKILSLQLLLYLLEHSGPIFRSGDMFIGGIKKYLIVSLYSNASLDDQAIFSLMSQIFYILLTLFPAHLKVSFAFFSFFFFSCPLVDSNLLFGLFCVLSTKLRCASKRSSSSCWQTKDPPHSKKSWCWTC